MFHCFDREGELKLEASKPTILLYHPDLEPGTA
jgi:hypothetical protein